MKKFLKNLAVFAVLACVLTVMAAAVTLYAPGGKTINVHEWEVDSYKAVGWYEKVKLYSYDGSTISVLPWEVDAYVAYGWHKSADAVKKTLYSADGDTITVYKSEVNSYKAVGWYTEPVCYLYSLDGKTIIVEKSKVAEYKKVGWYDRYSDTVSILYGFDYDGEYIKYELAPKNKVADYLNVGWYASLSDLVTANINSGNLYPLARALTEEIDNYADNYYNIIDADTLYRERGRVLSVLSENDGNCPLICIGYYIFDDTESSYSTTRYLEKSFINFSNKTITAYEFDLALYNSFGEPAKNNYGKNYDEGYYNENISIKSGQEYISWTDVTEFKRAKFADIVITKVAFSDGSVWRRNGY